MIYKGKEVTPGLERIWRLMELTGHPEDEVRMIHIAGTNGKGSVGSFIVSILREAGYRVGHFHTPALFSTREEICIDGEAIPEAVLRKYEKKISNISKDSSFQKTGTPSPFEIETATAFMYFRDRKCDYAVIECGMGGRLDATNVIRHPAVSVLASISLDHMDYLGSSVTEIAHEKCGILKSGSPAAAIAEDEEVCSVIREEAQNKKCSISFVHTNMLHLIRADIEYGQYFDFGNLENLHIQSAASYQLRNAALAVKAALLLGDHAPDEECIRRGLSKMRWPARFEAVSINPLILYDGAHNPAAAQRLKDSILSVIPDRPIILIMGVLADKDYSGMLHILSAINARLITFAPDSPRAPPASALAKAAEGLFEQIFPADTLEQAWDKYLRWKQEMPENTALIQCGTLSAYASFCRQFEKFQNKNGE